MRQGENVLAGVVRDESLWGLWCQQACTMSGFSAPGASGWVCDSCHGRVSGINKICFLCSSYCRS